VNYIASAFDMPNENTAATAHEISDYNWSDYKTMDMVIEEEMAAEICSKPKARHVCW
jgi:hypothetical protein